MKNNSVQHMSRCLRLGGHSILVSYPKGDAELDGALKLALNAHVCCVYQTSLDIPQVLITKRDDGFIISYDEHSDVATDIPFLFQNLYDYLLKALDFQIRDGLLLHAACVQDKYGNVFVLPGGRGNGKTTTALWFASQGYSIISDELLYFNKQSNRIYGLNRPLMIKSGSKDFIPFYSTVTNPDQELINNGEVYVLPIDKTNGQFKKSVALDHRVHFIFPSYDEAVKPSQFSTLKLNTGKTSELLLNNCVNLRSLELGGLPHVAHVLDRCGAGGTLTFSSFDHLQEFFNPDVLAHQGGEVG